MFRGTRRRHALLPLLPEKVSTSQGDFVLEELIDTRPEVFSLPNLSSRTLSLLGGRFHGVLVVRSVRVRYLDFLFDTKEFWMVEGKSALRITNSESVRHN